MTLIDTCITASSIQSLYHLSTGYKCGSENVFSEHLQSVIKS